MGKKVFESQLNGRDIKVRIVSINPEIRRNAQKYYAKALSEAFAANLPLRVEIDTMLETKNLEVSEKEMRKVQHEIRKEITSMEKQLRSAKLEDGSKMTKEQGKELALAIRQKRSELLQNNNPAAEFYTNTAENYAENEQTLFYIYACSVDATSGKSLWPTFEDFKQDADNTQNSDLIRELTRQFFSTIGGVDLDYEKNFYEIQWLIRMGYMNDKLQLINDKGQLIDSEGRLINEDGRFINENAELVDIYGNRVDEKGQLIIEDGWQ